VAIHDAAAGVALGVDVDPELNLQVLDAGDQLLVDDRGTDREPLPPQRRDGIVRRGQSGRLTHVIAVDDELVDLGSRVRARRGRAGEYASRLQAPALDVHPVRLRDDVL